MAGNRGIFTLPALVFCLSAGSYASTIEAAPWIQAGQVALKTHQDILAKGYFDQAIKLAENARESILQIGFLWLDNGRLETSLPYLMPNLSGLTPEQLSRLEKALEDRNHVSAAIVVLRHHASRSRHFSAEAARAADWAFLSGNPALCREILLPHVAEFDSASARHFLLVNFYTAGKLSPEALHKAASRSPASGVRDLAALNHAQQRNFKDARTFLDGNSPLPIRGYVEALELDASDRPEEAAESFKQALDSKWPEFRIIVLTEFFKHYSLTGNRYKVDQLWDEIKSREANDTLPAFKEFLAWQLGLRGYEKQSKYLYRNLYRTHPARPGVLKALWRELAADDSSGLDLQIRSLLASDSLDCDANLMAMRYAKSHSRDLETVHHGRNAVLYCSDVVEPYLDVGNALLAVSRPDEARVYFGKYVRHGGDRNRVPTYMR